MHVAKSYYSLRYGMIPPGELPAAAQRARSKYLILADINQTAAWYPFERACHAAGIKPILGIEFRDREHNHLYTGIAKNRRGLLELTRLLNRFTQHRESLPRRPPRLPNCFLIYPWCRQPVPPGRLYPNERIGVRVHEVALVYGSNAARYPERMVAFLPLTFRTSTDRETHRLLRAIDRNVPLARVPRHDCARADELVTPPITRRRFYDPAPPSTR